jgi:hypothetical protein
MAFSITPAARAALERRIVQSSVADPVITFIRVATDFQSDPELKRLLAAPESDEALVREKFLQLNPDTTTLNWRWAPAVDARALIHQPFLYEVEGIVFVLPGPMRERLMNATLDIDETGFIFRGMGESVEPF